MAQFGCYQSLQFCAVRASSLDADGSPLVDGVGMVGTNESAFNMRPVTLGISPTITTGDRFEFKAGCGDQCAIFEDCDKMTGIGLTLTLCHFDVELLEILTGGTLHLAGGGESIGWSPPFSTDSCLDGAEFDAWSKAWDSTEQVAVLAPPAVDYWHWVFPRTTWVLADQTLENGFLTLTLTGKVAENSNLGDGAFNDLPATYTGQLLGVFLATDIPDPTLPPYDANGLICGYVDTPIQ